MSVTRGFRGCRMDGDSVGDKFWSRRILACALESVWGRRGEVDPLHK